MPPGTSQICPIQACEYNKVTQNIFPSIKMEHISFISTWILKVIVFMDFFPSFMNHTLAPKLHYSFHCFIFLWLDMSSADSMTFWIFIYFISVMCTVCWNHKSLLCTFTNFFRKCCSAYSYLVVAQSFSRKTIF